MANRNQPFQIESLFTFLSLYKNHGKSESAISNRRQTFGRQGIMAINKIGAMAILFCGMILLGANVEVKAVRHGLLRPCPRNCIGGSVYKICNGTKTYTTCTNCCVSDGCTVYFIGGFSIDCKWPYATY
nr:uncharacterized protein LOC113702839 [Coffea arabica]